MDANSTMHVESIVPHNIVNGTHSQLIAFLILNIWPAFFALPILLFIVLTRKVQRHATFANLLVVFIIVGISSSLLLFAGKHEGPEPSKTLCLFQASLMYGVPAISSIAALTLVLQMFLVIRASFYGQPYHERDHVLRTWMMIVAPYVVWLICIVVTAAIGAAYPDHVSRNRRFFYCSVWSDPWTNTITVTAALVLFATIALEVATVVLFYKGWRKIQQGSPSPSKGIELNLPIRILSFGLYLALAMSLSLLSVKTPQSPAPDLIIASAASVVVFIFGTQRDIIRVFCFWKSRPESTATDAASIRSIAKERPSLG